MSKKSKIKDAALTDLILSRKEVEELSGDGLKKLLKEFDQYITNNNKLNVSKIEKENELNCTNIENQLHEFENKIIKEINKNEKLSKTKLKISIKLRETKNELNSKIRDISNIKLNTNKIKKEKLNTKKLEIEKLQEIHNKLSIKYDKLKSIDELKKETAVDNLIKKRSEISLNYCNKIFNNLNKKKNYKKNNNDENIFKELYNLLYLISEYKIKQIKRNESVNISKQQRDKQQQNSNQLKQKRDTQKKYIIDKIKNIDHKFDGIKNEKIEYGKKISNKLKIDNECNISVESSIGLNDSVSSVKSGVFKNIINKDNDVKMRTLQSLLIYCENLLPLQWQNAVLKWKETIENEKKDSIKEYVKPCEFINKIKQEIINKENNEWKDNYLLSHSMDNLEEFHEVGVTPPMIISELPETIETLLYDFHYLKTTNN